MSTFRSRSAAGGGSRFGTGVRPLPGVAIDWEETLAIGIKARVLASLERRYSISERHGVPATVERLHGRRIREVFPSLSEERIVREFGEVYRDLGSLEPSHPDLAGVFAGLAKRASLHIVTATIAPRHTVVAWLRLNGMGPYVADVTLVKRSTMKAALPGMSACIEDNSTVAGAFASSGRPALLVRRVWNEDAVARAEADGRRSLVAPIDHLGEAEAELSRLIRI